MSRSLRHQANFLFEVNKPLENTNGSLQKWKHLFQLFVAKETILYFVIMPKSYTGTHTHTNTEVIFRKYCLTKRTGGKIRRHRACVIDDAEAMTSGYSHLQFIYGQSSSKKEHNNI